MIQLRTQANLREENRSLRQQIAQLKAANESLSHRVARAKGTLAPRLPAPPMQVTNPPSALATEDLQPTNRIARLIDKEPKLTPEQVKSYLQANGRNASSLLAAYRTSGDKALLEEAMEKYPNDPQVDFEAVFDKDLSPEQQRQWLNTFEQSAPNNALANYLSALNYFNAGQTDLAVQELIAASSKPQFQDYTANSVQDNEEVYLAAGYSAAEAKALAFLPTTLQPELLGLKQLGQDLVGLANSYQQTGDHDSAQAALQMAMNLGQQASTGTLMIDQDLGRKIEQNALSAMNPKDPYGDNGQTVQYQINQLTQQRAASHELDALADPLMEAMSDQDWVSFTDRMQAFGEQAAFQWLVNKHGQN